MIKYLYDNDLAPANVFNWQHPGLQWFRSSQIYKWLDLVDQTKISIYLNFSDGPLPRCDTPIAILTMMGESPRLEILQEFCLKQPDTRILLLADIDFYDYRVPPEVTVIKYRQWIWYLDWFLHSDQPAVTRAKNKTISHKFSSLSFKKTQFRALVTCFLLGRAADHSLVSWHRCDDNFDGESWIDQYRNHERFSHLDWGLLDNSKFLDDFNSRNNSPAANLINFRFPAFETCLINLTNETLNYGQVCDQEETYFYNNPGPYLTEKTWKALITGCVPMHCAQPGVYQWLAQNYSIPANWQIPICYDTVLEDFDRAEMLLQSLDQLANMPLKDLIDSNIDHCDQVQSMILDHRYLNEVYKFNEQQDELIAALCD